MGPSSKVLHGNGGTSIDLLERVGSIAALWSSEGRTFRGLSSRKEGEGSAGASLWTFDRRESKMSTESASSVAPYFFRGEKARESKAEEFSLQGMLESWVSRKCHASMSATSSHRKVSVQ